jgi:glycosyltransferase involved in cell wall biosynthesis
MRDDGAAGVSPRILHVIPSLDIGGTERQLVELIRRSPGAGRHIVAVFDRRGALADDAGVEIVELPVLRRDARGFLSTARTVASLRSLVRARRPDVVHAHLGIAEVLAAAAVPRGVAIVASRRGRNVGFERSRTLRLVEGFGHRRIDVLICNSRFLADRARADLWTPPTVVIPNGIDLGRYPVRPLPSDAAVTMVANLWSYKGHDLFLDAVAGLHADIPGLRVVLVGDGQARAELEEMAKVLRIDGLVKFAGSVADTRPYVEGCSVVCLTSRHESFPNALLEAMAMARPVVATRVGGVPELVRDRVDGLLVAPEAAAVANALRTLLSDAGMRERMGRAGRARAGRFSWDAVVAATEDVYARVLGGPARPRRARPPRARGGAPCAG